MIPHAYAEWLIVLDKFGAGDDSVLDAMNQGTLDWTNVVAERWTRQVATCLNGRLQALSTQLQTMLDRSRGDHFAISNALLTTRRALSPLWSFVHLRVLPDDVKQHLISELDRWTSETQKSLEAHAEGVRHDQGRLLKTIRDHPLRAAARETPSPQTGDTSGGATNPPAKGRRVIL